MKRKVFWRIISLVLVLATLVTSLPLSVFAEELDEKEETTSETVVEVYIKDVKLIEGKTKEEAKEALENEGYIFFDSNFNEGTGEGAVWMGYTTTTDPNEAIYDLSFMNMKGGFTLTSVEEALRSQESAFAQMASDLSLLVEEFIDAYEAESVPAKKAYKALNFFRVVDSENSPLEENGLGYQIVQGNMDIAHITEILMFCDATIVDTIVKLLTMGVQLRNGNWLEKLSAKGPYDSETIYGDDEMELLRRAEQLLMVIEIYASTYAAMDKSGIIPDDIDDNFESKYDTAPKDGNLTAEESDLKKIDEGRYKYYKVAFDELDKYKYGNDGDTLKDFFLSFAEGGSEKALYPMISVLSDAEFSALSYGCFLEVVSGANATVEGFANYDETFAEVTKEVSSVYLYVGVDSVLLDDDSIIGFTDTATRHMATTGEMEFYENERNSEYIWTTGKHVTMVLGAIGLAFIALPKLAIGVTMIAGAVSATVAGSIKSGVLAGVIKYCTLISGATTFWIAVAVVAAAALISLIWSIHERNEENKIDWKKNPMPEYLYDVKEVTFSQSSTGGVGTEPMKRSVFTLYEAVTDVDGNIVDLNAHSGDASQWIGMYVSYDKQGEEAKPIKADGLLVQTGNGETPVDYVPATRFGEVVACDLNQWDGDDSVNGVYFFYKQDKTVIVESDKKYYISDVFLQSGKSVDHCIELLEAAGYTPLNVNLSPDYSDAGIVNEQRTATVLGYKVTQNADNAIRDIRMMPIDSAVEVKYGAATYAQCGSSGRASLYATKYKSAGTPLLAGGIICVNSHYSAPQGYEPVNQFAGGPATSFNLDLYIRQTYDDVPYFLYFLPEKTFTEGNLYLGGLTYVDGVNGAYRDEHYMYVSGFQYAYPDPNQLFDAIVYTSTYNPYRAVYDLKVTSLDGAVNNVVFEGVGYYKWEPQALCYVAAYYNSTSIQYLCTMMQGAVYVSGNPYGDNIYEETIIEKEKEKTEESTTTPTSTTVETPVENPTETPSDTPTDTPTETPSDTPTDTPTDTPEKEPEVEIEIIKGMSMQEPILLSDFIITTKGSDMEKTILADPDSGFEAVPDAFGNSDESGYVKSNESDYAGYYKFVFYINRKTKQRPYVSNILVADKLSIIRGYGEDPDVWYHDISETILLSQLANQGATNFLAYSPVLRQTDVWDSSVLDSYDDLNSYRFAFTRTATKKEALRDVFIYFNEFSTDKPPKSLYKNGYEYKLLSEISFNFMVYGDAPKPSAYIYGTTESKAGDPIIDFEVSDSPFKDGFETVRTINDRSLYAEINDYTISQKDSHPLSWARELYNALYKYFNNDDGKDNNTYFYLHIKRDGDSVRKQKPYIGELYATYGDNDKKTVLDRLFDMGAEGAVDFNLNDDAGGKKIYIGYSYTADPADAIKDIRLYHKKNPPKTLVDDDGKTYTLASDLDLNKGAGGDYIYLYTTTESEDSAPLESLYAKKSYVVGAGKVTWYDGATTVAYTTPAKVWDSNKYSDLNAGTGDDKIYLMCTTVQSSFVGTYKAPKVAKDKTYTRDEYKKVDPNGDYIGGLYVMDKLTVLKEKKAAGTISASSTVKNITDQDVYDRLTAMGATTIIKTPITINNTDYFKGNQNKAFIGYSKTSDKSKAIKSIAIRSEILSLDQPSETLTIDGVTFNLVAEAAKKVTKLPEAINLIAVEGYEDMLLPRFYLYTSTSGEAPIYDISIDGSPLVNGWVTVRSQNKLNPFADIYEQSHELYEIANQEDWDRYDSEIVYTDPLFEYMKQVYKLFDPENVKATPFYVHYKNYDAKSIEEVKPYIGEIFLAEADSKSEALSMLISHAPDGFVEVNLNQDAGGKKIYMAYKRVAKAKDALTDIVVYQGKKFEPSRRIDINGKSVKYTLVADIDLNEDAGGKYLYLYASDSSSTGNPITNLELKEKTETSLKCGVEKVTVVRADGKNLTTEKIDLNKGAGGDYIYMIMTRETDLGHKSNGKVTETIVTSATCVEDGNCIEVTACSDCGARLETVKETYKANGIHIDDQSDGDHDCDVCGKFDVSDHKISGYVEEDTENPGKFKYVSRCTDCKEPTGEEYPIEESTTYSFYLDGTASLFSSGSLVAIISFVGIAAIAAAIIVYLKKRETVTETTEKVDGNSKV